MKNNRNLDVKLTRKFLEDLVDLDNSKLRNKALGSITKEGKFLKDNDDHRLEGLKKYDLWTKYVQKTSRRGLARLLYFQKGSVIYFWRLLTDHDEYEKLTDQKVRTAYENLEYTAGLAASAEATTVVEELKLAYTADTKENEDNVFFDADHWIQSEVFLKRNIETNNTNCSEIFIVAPYIGKILNRVETIGGELDKNIAKGTSVVLITRPPKIKSETKQRKDLLKKYKRRNYSREERKNKTCWQKIVADFKVSDPSNLLRCKHAATNQVLHDHKAVNLCKDCKVIYEQDGHFKNLRLVNDDETQTVFFRTLAEKDARASGKKTEKQRLDELQIRGFQIYFHKNLHTKTYYIEEFQYVQGQETNSYPTVYIGSGNISNNGMKRGNLELGYTFSNKNAFLVKDYIEFLKQDSQSMNDFFDRDEMDLLREIVEVEVWAIHASGRRTPGRSVEHLVAKAVRRYFKHIAKRNIQSGLDEDEKNEQIEQYLKEKEGHALDILRENFTIESNLYFSIQ